MAVDKLDSRGKVLLENEDIVGQVIGPELAYSLVEFIAQDEVVVRFILYHVANGLELAMGTQLFEVFFHSRVRKWDPSNHALDSVTFVSETQKPFGFLHSLTSLDNHRSGYPGGIGAGQQVGEEVILREHGTGSDPGILTWIVSPEVVVGVDHGEES